ncbi:hypothetical protein [Mycolicibacterium sp.]|uniref:hypothetical protein n=1 Tax=Mycolicibacterium sp. TaxID=2320850 RepID=UPI003D144A13
MSSVMVLGRASALAASILAALRDLEVDVVEDAAPRGVSPRSDTTVPAVDSMLVVFEAARPEVLLADRGFRWSRLRLWAYENEACDLAVTSALGTGARRLVLACDGRQLTFGQRVRATGFLRRLAHRIDYECAVNGSPWEGALFAVVNTDDDVARVAAAAADPMARAGVTPRRDGWP